MLTHCCLSALLHLSGFAQDPHNCSQGLFEKSFFFLIIFRLNFVVDEISASASLALASGYRQQLSYDLLATCTQTCQLFRFLCPLRVVSCFPNSRQRKREEHQQWITSGEKLILLLATAGESKRGKMKKDTSSIDNTKNEWKLKASRLHPRTHCSHRGQTQRPPWERATLSECLSARPQATMRLDFPLKHNVEPTCILYVLLCL